MTNTKLLRSYIDKSGYKMRFLAEKLGISYPALLHKVNNETSFKPEEIATLCPLVGIATLEEKERVFFASDVD